jgi:pyruvate/2-oxoglutarate dehydrogenase complex dihydrolipoamide dehydrogenase (E3) component
MDKEMAKTMERIFKKQGMKFKLKTKVNSAEVQQMFWGRSVEV